MDRLYASWRHAYVTGSRDTDDCVFCAAQRSADAGALIVHEAPLAYIILNLFPYNSGHLLVVPRRHIADLTALTRDELIVMAELTQAAAQVLIEEYAPQGINVGMNLGKPAGAGVADHLHTHLVPRWAGDTNFMTVVGDVRVLPEEIVQTAARLRPAFARIVASR